MSMLPEILFDIPGTAHCIGGCVIADSPQRGVVDHHHRVFGYRNMYICDGSVLASNLGVNPSLTITALAERAIVCDQAAGHVMCDRTDEPAHDLHADARRPADERFGALPRDDVRELPALTDDR